MMRSFKLIVTFVLVYSSLVAANKDDLIYLKGKKDPVAVFIDKESDKEVVFKDLATGAKQKMPIGRVDKIIYKDSHATFISGMSALKTKNYSYALRKFKEAKKLQKKSRGNWHTYYIPWYFNYSLYHSFLKSKSEKNGKIAVKLFKQYKDKYPKTRFASEASVYIANIQLALGDFKGAQETYEKILKTTKSANAKARASFGLVNIFKSKGEFDKGITLGKKVVNDGQVSRDLLSLLSMMMMKKNQQQEALKMAEAILKTAKLSSDVKGAAFELKGVSLVHMKKYEEALNNLLYSKLEFPAAKEKMSNLNLYLALTIKILMEKKGNVYEAWEYTRKYQGFYNTLSNKQRLFIKKFKS